MMIRNRVMMIGAGAGVIGAALVLAAVAYLDRTLGGALGLLASAAVGALAARLAADAIGFRVATQLAHLEEERGDRPAPLPAPLHLGALDDAIDSLRQSLVRSSRLQAESEAI